MCHKGKQLLCTKVYYGTIDVFVNPSNIRFGLSLFIAVFCCNYSSFNFSFTEDCDLIITSREILNYSYIWITRTQDTRQIDTFPVKSIHSVHNTIFLSLCSRIFSGLRLNNKVPMCFTLFYEISSTVCRLLLLVLETF